MGFIVHLFYLAQRWHAPELRFVGMIGRLHNFLVENLCILSIA
jgi:hypothetical protein